MKTYQDGKSDDMSKLRIYLRNGIGVFIGVLLLFTSLPGYSQSSEVTLRNDSLIDANNLIVDIYVRATSGSFYYSWGQYKISFNSAITNGGTISGAIVPGYSDLTNTTQLPASIIVGSTSWRATAGTIPGDQASCSQISASGIGTRICRVRLTNTATFAINTADMQVVTTPPNATAVYYSDAGGFSVEGAVTMVNTNLTNPVLNAAITTYNVTGGGTSPASVGLSGSQSDGVNYTLYKDGSPSGSAIDGTGSILSFGPQTTGSYTVMAHRNATYLSGLMNGTAIVSSALVSIPTATPGTVCAGASVQLAAGASGGTGSYTYSWSSSPAGFSSSLANPTATPSVNTIYYVNVNDGVTNVNSQVSVTVNAIPTITGTTPGSRCGTGVVTLGATASAGTINWYAAATGGSSLGTGTSYTTPSISSTTTYYVDATSGSCTTASRTSVTATINAVPASPTQTVDCSLGFGQAVVTVTGPLGAGYEYRLDAGTYQTGTSFTAVANGSHTITVRNAAGCTTTGGSFDVSCGCVNGPTVTLSNTTGSTCGTTPVTVAGNTFGGSATQVTISENGAGTVNPASATASPFSFTYTPAAGDIGNTVTVTVTTNNPLGAPCVAATATYTLTVNAIPTITGTTPGSRCGTGTVILGATASAGTINWYAAPTGGASLGTGTSFTTTSISATTTYYADATNNGCTTASRTAVTATVNTIPTITGTTPGSRCGTGTVILGATASAGTINWYAASTGGASLGTGTSFTTPSINSTTTYYVDATSGSCTTATRTSVVATVNAVPVVDAGTNQNIPYGTNTTLNATVTGSGLSYSWDPASLLVNATVEDPITVNLTVNNNLYFNGNIRIMLCFGSGNCNHFGRSIKCSCNGHTFHNLLRCNCTTLCRSQRRHRLLYLFMDFNSVGIYIRCSKSNSNTCSKYYLLC